MSLFREGSDNGKFTFERQVLDVSGRAYLARLAEKDQEVFRVFVSDLKGITGALETRARQLAQDAELSPVGKAERLKSFVSKLTNKELAGWRQKIAERRAELEASINERIATPRGEPSLTVALREQLILQHVLGRSSSEHQAIYVGALRQGDFETAAAIENAPRILGIYTESMKELGTKYRRAQVLADAEVSSANESVSAQERLLENAERHVVEVLKACGVTEAVGVAA